MDRPDKRFAFWLVPAAHEQTFFTSLIRELALRFDAPIFQPHLTLQSAKLDEDTARKVLQNLPACSSYELEVDSIEVSERFTKTLFVRFRSSEELNQLRNAIGDAVQMREIGEFDPHLSLLYKEISLAKKTELGSTIAIPFERVSFNGINLIAHLARITTRADVDAWRILARRSLADSSR